MHRENNSHVSSPMLDIEPELNGYDPQEQLRALNEPDIKPPEEYDQETPSLEQPDLDILVPGEPQQDDLDSMDSLILTAPHFRGSLDVDEERAQKGITFLTERTQFDRSADAALEHISVISDAQDKEEPLTAREEDTDEPEEAKNPEDEPEENVLPDGEEDEPYEGGKRKEKRKNPGKNHIRPDSDEDAAWEPREPEEPKEDTWDAVEDYYRNPGKQNGVQKKPASLDGTARPAGSNVWEHNPDDLSGPIQPAEVHGDDEKANRSKTRAENIETTGNKSGVKTPAMADDWGSGLENLASIFDTGEKLAKVQEPIREEAVPEDGPFSGQKRFVPEHAIQSLDDDEKEWQAFLSQDIYTGAADIHDLAYEVKTGESSLKKNQKEFNQSLADDQKEWEDILYESQEITSQKTSAALAFGTAVSTALHGRNIHGEDKKDSNTAMGMRDHNGRNAKGIKQTNSMHADFGNPRSRFQSESKAGSDSGKYQKEYSQSLEDDQKDWEQAQRSDSTGNGNGKNNQFIGGASGDTDMFVSAHPKIAFGRQTGRTILKNIKKTGRYGIMYAVSSIQGNAAADGMILMGRTAGTYMLMPYARHISRQLARRKTFALLRRMNRSAEFDFLRDGKRMGNIIKPYVKSQYGKKYTEGMEYRYMEPRRVRDVLQAKKWLETELRYRGMPIYAGQLKRLLKEGKLNGSREDIARAYLEFQKIECAAKRGKFTPLKDVRSLAYRIRFSAKTQVRRSANENNNHSIVGALTAAKFARTGVKSIYRAAGSTVKAAKYLIPKVARGRSKTSAGQRHTADRRDGSAAPANGAPAFKRPRMSRTKRALGKAGRMAAKAASTSAERMPNAGERFSDNIKQTAKTAGRKAAEVSAKASVKSAQKVSALMVKAAVAVVHLVLNLLGTIMAMFGPVIIISIVLFAAIASFTSLFETDSDFYYDNTVQMTEDEKEADDEISLQQYADILSSCHENYKSKLQNLYADGSYETVSITYRDRRNDGVTGIYTEAAEESNSIETGNNIKEILTMASALFGFDYEGYATDKSKWGWASEIYNVNKSSRKDRSKLENFLEESGMDSSEYKDTTYQKLIRSYLIGLFNGSHKTDKKVEITYCGGCMASGTDKEGITIYQCPGHRHLYVNVTTYYFDDIYTCKLKAKSDMDEPSSMVPSISTAGSSTIEKLWNGITSAGYTEEAAAGIIGNLMWESGGGPSDVKLNAVESTGEGIGMVQWSSDRKTAFLNFLAARGIPWPNEDVTCQLEFMLYELNNGQWSWAGTGYGYAPETQTSLENFRTAKDVAMAAQYFCANFERCYFSDAHMDTRIVYAQGVYNVYHGKTAAHSSEGGEQT